MGAGTPELDAVETLSMKVNLISLRAADHLTSEEGEPNANEKGDSELGRRTQDRQGELQGRERRCWGAVQIQLTLREGGGVETGRNNHPPRSSVPQPGAQRRAGGEWKPANPRT